MNSIWIMNLNVKCRTMKFVEDNIVENLDDVGYGDAFFDTIPRIQYYLLCLFLKILRKKILISWNSLKLKTSVL